MSIPTAPSSHTVDLRGRPLHSLRISITDRCNLRCEYCMPGEKYTWLPSKDILSFEEILRISGLFADTGATRLRLTGGEPLLRKNADRLVAMICAAGRFEEVAMTTNALGLAKSAQALKAAGLSRLTISLDSLQQERVKAISGRDSLSQVLAGLDAAAEAGFTDTKLDTVAMRGVNDDEFCDLLSFGAERDIEVRFIEYMDVPGAQEWTPDKVISRTAILDLFEISLGVRPQPTGNQGSAPAARFVLPDGATWKGRDLTGLVFGIIASTTEPFCGSCDRSRVTADGMWFKCLYAELGVNLLKEIRKGVSDDQLRAQLTGEWRARDDRGAELRFEEEERSAYKNSGDNPHLEMHTRGG
jgi:cyclic pyranopterin phosphate synthase